MHLEKMELYLTYVFSEYSLNSLYPCCLTKYKKIKKHSGTSLILNTINVIYQLPPLPPSPDNNFAPYLHYCAHCAGRGGEEEGT